MDLKKSEAILSLEDAISQGYVVAGPQIYEVYRGCNIYGYDLSGSRIKGQVFTVRVEITERFTANYLGNHSLHTFGQSCTLQIEHGMHGLGGKQCIHVFTSEVFSKAIEDARRWTDFWFWMHPAPRSRRQHRLETISNIQPA